MKPKKQKHHWLIDAALFVGLLLSFWLELTGVALHQWLGVALGAGATYHLLTHWTWIKSVTDRFFKQTSGQARLYYVIDAIVLIGLATIIVTGLVISTWLNLTLTNFAAWKSLHVIASIGTLIVVVVKIGLHWCWIVSTARRYIYVGKVPGHKQPIPVAVGMGRREFLRLMGGVSTLAMIATVGAVNALKQTVASSTTSSAPQAVTSSTTISTTTQATSNPASTSCTVRCNKGCSYPGQCRRYTDSNNNGKCDLGECV